MFWVTNSIVPTNVTVGNASQADLLSGVIPADREALRRITIKRMILSLQVSALTTATKITFGYSVTEVTEHAALVGQTPDIGDEEVGMYLAVDGLTWTPPQGFEPMVRDHDIRSSRALRGSDRTLVFKITNQDATSTLVFNLSFRLLVAY